MSFENNFDSNRRIIHGVIPDFCEIVCAICLETNENQSVFRFVCMDALQN